MTLASLASQGGRSLHTGSGSPDESSGSPAGGSSIELRSRSSAGERLLHTQDVASSILAATTITQEALMARIPIVGFVSDEELHAIPVREEVLRMAAERAARTGEQVDVKAGEEVIATFGPYEVVEARTTCEGDALSGWSGHAELTMRKAPATEVTEAPTPSLQREVSSPEDRPQQRGPQPPRSRPGS